MRFNVGELRFRVAIRLGRGSACFAFVFIAAFVAGAIFPGDALCCAYAGALIARKASAKRRRGELMICL
jgi:hypothetical protein